MKKLNLLAVATLVALGLMSCESKDVKLYPSFTHESIANVHSSGSYTQSADMYVSELSNAINDLNTDGSITDVMVEGIILEINKDVLSGYALTTTNQTALSVTLLGWDNVEYPIIENLTVNLNKSTQEISLSPYLKKAGVKQLRDILKLIAQQNVPNGKEKVGVKIVGTNTPANGYINAEIKVKVKVAVEFATTIEGI